MSLLSRRMLLLLNEEEYVMNKGTFIGDGTNQVNIPIDYEPDIICIIRNDTEAKENTMIYGVTIIRDTYGSATYTAANSSAITNGGHIYNIDGLYASVNINANYDQNNLNVFCYSGGRKFGDEIEYKYILGKLR